MSYLAVFILATLHMRNVGRVGTGFLGWRHVGSKAELQRFASFHNLILLLTPSTRCLAAAFVEMFWMCGPKVNSMSSVILRNSDSIVGNDCGFPIHIMEVCGEESPLSSFIWILWSEARFERTSCNQRTKEIGRPFMDAASRSSSLQTRSNSF